MSKEAIATVAKRREQVTEQHANFDEHKGYTVKIRIMLVSGGIAQLGERLHGMQEVSGSIPLTSTIKTKKTGFIPVFLF